MDSDQERQKWDKYYASLPSIQEDEIIAAFNQEFVESISRILPAGGKTLEAGAGAGWQSLALARTGKYRVSLSDFSSEALGYAKRLFERENVEAELFQEDVLQPGIPEYDLVFNAGVLEHYTFDQQVAFVRGMASRSKRFVMILVPNRLCYWYWLWRIQKSSQRIWPFGKEVPLIDLSDVFQAAGLHTIGQKFMGATWTETFFQYIDGISADFRKDLMTVHRSPFIPAAQKSYLLAALASVQSEMQFELVDWHKNIQTESIQIAELSASLADSLALNIDAENQIRQVQQTLNEAEQELMLKQGEIMEQNQQIEALQQQSEALSEILAEKDQNIEQLTALLGQRDNVLNQQKTLLDQKDQIIQQQELDLATKDQTIGQQNIEINARKRDSAMLSEIMGSRAWRLIRILWRLRLTLDPSNRVLESLSALKKLPPTETKIDGENQIQSILAKYPDVQEIIIYPPSIEWDIHLFQRPQQMALAYSQENCLVFYCDPEYSQSPPGLRQIKDRLYGFKGDLSTLKAIPSPLVIVYSYNKHWLTHFDRPRVIYEYIDELTVFDGELKKLNEDHAELLNSAEIVIATAESLLEQVQTNRPDAILCPNGVDYDHFHVARNLSASVPTPLELQSIVNRGSTIIGYYGALARWFDYNLIGKIAVQRPDWHFVLIGPDYDGSMHKSNLLELSNVHWLGIRDYQDLPLYLRCFDVATIPFTINDITNSTSPLKLFEYMAGGKPVVITPMRESMRTSGVLVANSNEFIQKIELALSLREDQDYLHLIDQVAKENTWENRVKLILENIPTK